MIRRGNMRRLLALALLLLFVQQAATPRLRLLHHRHGGGELAHVHADEIDSLVEEQVRGGAQATARRDAPSGLGLSAALHDHPTHAHWQQLFQRADCPATIDLAVRWQAVAWAQTQRQRCGRAAEVVPQVRGPPLPTIA